MVADLKIVIPNESLTAGDIVGRSVRIARNNWLTLIQFFLIPTFINDLSSGLLFWSPEPSGAGMSPAVKYWLICASFILLCLSSWELGVRRYALLIFIANQATTLKEALRLARKRIWLVLLIVIPIIAVAIFTAAYALFIQLLTRALEATNASAHFQAEILLISLVLLLLLLFPNVFVVLTNTFFMSILMFENSSINKSIRRSLSIGLPFSQYFLQCTLLLSVVYITGFIPSILTEIIAFFLPKGIATSVFQLILESTLDTPLYAFLDAVLTICGACLYKQMCARLEGQDLLDKLKVVGKS